MGNNSGAAANDATTDLTGPDGTAVQPVLPPDVAPTSDPTAPPDVTASPDQTPATGVAAVPDTAPPTDPPPDSDNLPPSTDQAQPVTSPGTAATASAAAGSPTAAGAPMPSGTGSTADTTSRATDPGSPAGADDLAQAHLTEPATGVAAPDVDPGRDEGWHQPGDWQVQTAPQQLGHPYAGHHDVPPHQQFEESDEYDDDYADEYSDGALFATILSAPSLALAAFVFALTGLLGGMIPESLPYLVQIDPGNGPAYHVRIIGLIALGFAIVAASLGLAAMLRSIGSPLRWPRYLGGAAVLLALLIALQSVLLIVLAGLAPEQGGMS